jgi:hypothetical protein
MGVVAMAFTCPKLNPDHADTLGFADLVFHETYSHRQPLNVPTTCQRGYVLTLAIRLCVLN